MKTIDDSEKERMLKTSFKAELKTESEKYWKCPSFLSRFNNQEPSLCSGNFQV